MAEQLFHIGIKGLIQNSEGRYLLFKEDVSNHSIPTDVYWDLVGGRMEEGEAPMQTLRREITEETGISDLKSAAFFTAVVSNHQIKLPNGELIGLALMIYKVTLHDNAVIALSDEHTEYEWVDSRDAAERLSTKYPAEFTDLL